MKLQLLVVGVQAIPGFLEMRKLASREDLEMFEKMAGRYSPRDTKACSNITDLVLERSGVFVRSRCSQSQTYHTFGIWGVVKGDYVERPNNKDMGLAITSEIKGFTPEGVEISQVPLVRRPPSHALDLVPNYFNMFSAQNCTENSYHSVTLSVLGLYSITKCNPEGPLELETGSFEIDAVASYNTTLNLKPNDGVMYPATIALKHKQNLIFNETPLTRAS
ncbi:hypothetical protein DSO57_1006094 [Entomophthora muscae]|uniref:Uncharacterized protein n=1 Tax=Entomophthora muscae TaxID=34485 RepID=A0ACC2SWN5_9FUNG|nr:hypothetical protein DSO57_1006094 [Entomophthora muscae]